MSNKPQNSVSYEVQYFQYKLANRSRDCNNAELQIAEKRFWALVDRLMNQNPLQNGIPSQCFHSYGRSHCPPSDRASTSLLMSRTQIGETPLLILASQCLDERVERIYS